MTPAERRAKRAARLRLLAVGIAVLPLGGAAGDPGESLEAELAAEIAAIRAVDHHAHPLAVVAPEETDEAYDAIVFDDLEPFDFPVALRPDHPERLAAIRALWTPEREGPLDLEAALAAKRRLQGELGESYPSWVLDRLGVDAMFANRLSRGAGLTPPRFHWVVFVDALLFPLDNERQKEATPDYRVFYDRIDRLRDRYLEACGHRRPPETLDGYLREVVVPTLERFRSEGAVAVKFEAAYFRSLAVDPVDRSRAEEVYGRSPAPPPAADYKALQDFLFHFIAREAGRLGLAVHIHTGAGAGAYFQVRQSNPLLLERMLKDPSLSGTRFVLIHGGWPFAQEIQGLLYAPNVFTDFSLMPSLLSPHALSEILRDWLSWVPEKVLFGTDAYPYEPLMSWEESAWVGTRSARKALAISLAAMIRDGEIDRARASELARMALRDNALRLYGLKGTEAGPPSP